MPETLNHSSGNRLKSFFRKRFRKIWEINRRYAKPRIKTSGPVALALLLLRIYLLILIGILVFKFYTLIK